jgi:hypothetical protein
MSNAARRGVLACVLAGTVIGGAAVVSSAPVAAQGCHPAYGGCLPWYEGDALNCADLWYQVVEVWDVYNDPYGLDDWDGPGNGWTCDSYSYTP